MVLYYDFVLKYSFLKTAMIRRQYCFRLQVKHIKINPKLYPKSESIMMYIPTYVWRTHETRCVGSK
jgi:hypothetical protein